MSSTSNQFTANVTNTYGVPLSSFELHGYRTSPELSEDESFMDIVMIITRSSMLRQGSMGCLLVRPITALHEMEADGEDGVANSTPKNNQTNHDDDAVNNQIFDRIIAAATNTDLFQTNDSDVHAEINAIGQVAKHHHLINNDPTSALPSTNSTSTKGATAYITMPPCKRCFGALYAAGIKRVVSRKQHPKILTEAASKVGIEMSCLSWKELQHQKVRLDKLFANYNDTNVGSTAEQGFTCKSVGGDDAQEEIARRRKERKEEKCVRKMARIERDSVEASTK